MSGLMTGVRFLTFEVSQTCNMAVLHPRCPVSDPERYKFGETSKVLDDLNIVRFWLWCRQVHGFEGTVLWHLYNEPSLANPRIQSLMEQMRGIEPTQMFHLWTNSHQKLANYDYIKLTNYTVVKPDDLDLRRLSSSGEGDYARARPEGHCTRSFGWEMIIDHHGNWLLCCNDWRNEESAGNILSTEWDEVFARYRAKASVKWSSRETWDVMPRLCRACITYNPNLHQTAIPYAVPNA